MGIWIVAFILGYGSFIVAPILAGIWWGWWAAFSILGGEVFLCWLINKWMYWGCNVRTNEGSWVGLIFPIVSGMAAMAVVLGIYFLF